MMPQKDPWCMWCLGFFRCRYQDVMWKTNRRLDCFFSSGSKPAVEFVIYWSKRCLGSITSIPCSEDVSLSTKLDVPRSGSDWINFCSDHWVLTHPTFFDVDPNFTLSFAGWAFCHFNINLHHMSVFLLQLQILQKTSKNLYVCLKGQSIRL